MTKPPDSPSRWRGRLSMVARGFAIGSADVVPGVSGGTIALVTGIYPRLVANLSAGARALGRLMRGDLAGGGAGLRAIEWGFLGPLALGAGVAIVTLARVIESLLASQPIPMAGLFFGMIAGTIVIAWRMLDRPGPGPAATAAAVGTMAFLLFGLQSSAVVNPSLLVFFAAGMVAVCAFILPGVSGSFLLLSIGMYQSVLSAVNDRDLAVVAAVGLGAAIGLGLFTQLLERMLDRHHDAVLSVLIGLMLGSVRILWPWPNGLGDENGIGATVLGAPRGEVIMPIVLAVVAALLVVGFSRWAGRREAG